MTLKGPRGIVLWFPNVLPLRSSFLDPRRWLARRFAERLIADAPQETLKRLLPPELLALGPRPEPNLKEGGLFVHFDSDPGKVSDGSEQSTKSLLATVNEHLAKLSKESFSLIDIFNKGPRAVGQALSVQGRPWVDDLWGRPPSRRLRVEFLPMGSPALPQDILFKAFRPFGPILDVRLAAPLPKDAPHFAFIDYVSKREAANARACLNGKEFFSGENSEDSLGKPLKVDISYEKVSRLAKYWAWVTVHPRIVIPILLGLLAGLSYAVFDPLRVASIENELTGGFSLKKSYGRLLSWWDSQWRQLRATFSLFLRPAGKKSEKGPANNGSTPSLVSWDERVQDLAKLSTTVSGMPESPILVSGPPGSGKSELVTLATREKPYSLRIDCAAIVSEDGYRSVGVLAEQVNYFPSFVSLASLSTLLDGLLSAATGTKVGQQGDSSIPGLSSSVETFLKRILATTSVALGDIVALEEKNKQRDLDAGLDVVTTINYPVIIVDSFLALNSPKAETFYKVLAEWAATVTDQQLAHVIFVSSQPSADKYLTRIQATRPIDTYILKDATPKNAMAYLSQNLQTVSNVSPKDLEICVQEIGGRLTYLELLVQKVLAGRSPLDSLSDIVGRSVAELSKIGFRKDGSLEPSSWSAIQFWRVVQLLSKRNEVPFDDLRFDQLFKGDPKALLAMERSGVVSIFRDQEREVSVLPGKPIFRAAFNAMLQDSKLSTTMGIDTYKQLISEEEKKLAVLESELLSLSTTKENLSTCTLVSFLFGDWSVAPASIGLRIRHLAQDIKASSIKLDTWNLEVARLKKSLKLSD